MTVRFEIDCGGYSGTFAAPTPQDAWAQFVHDKDNLEMGILVRFREIPWNGEYVWERPRTKKKDKRGSWYYVEPKWMEHSGSGASIMPRERAKP